MTEEKKKKKKKRKKEKLVSISPHTVWNDVNIIPRHLPVLPLSYAPAPTMTDGPQLPPSR